MTDVGGDPRLSSRSPKSIRLVRLVRLLRLVRLVPVAGLVAVAVPVTMSATAGATVPQSAEQAKAAQIEGEIQETGQEIGALDQRYEGAIEKKSSLDARITATQAQIGRSLGKIAKDRVVLHRVAIEAYVSGGTSAATDALFSTSQTLAMDSTVYSEVATGDIDTSMEAFHTAIAQLDAQRHNLRSEDAQASRAVATSRAAYQQAQTLETQLDAALAQVKGQIASVIAQQQAASRATQEAAAQATIVEARAQPAATPTATSTAATASTSAPAPPPSDGDVGAVAVRAAETQLGVPYVWGGEDPGVGFDCSGLVEWAWGQAGVSLPHYSGSQMEDSTPVSISDLQPGDLLFYGPGGSVHVAMYVGGGMMIEATLPGTVVRIDPVRFGTTFAGAGQP